MRGEAAKVMIGEDGWLFLQADRNDVIGQHTGRVRMGEQRLAAWERLLRARLATMDQLGLTWLCLIAPDKEAVYAEHLPAPLLPVPERPIHELLAVAERVGAPLMYPLAELLAAKGGRPIYCKTGTHWNQLGSYVAYRSICTQLARRGVALPTVEEAAIDWVEEELPEDLGEKLKPPRRGASVRAELRQHSASLVYDNGIANHGRVMVFEADAPARPTCVVFGESFGNHLLLFLKESFRRLVYVHTSMVDRVRLEEERPDVVLSLPVERFLIRVPDDAGAGEKLAEVADRKLAEGTFGANRFLRGIPRAAGV